MILRTALNLIKKVDTKGSGLKKLIAYGKRYRLRPKFEVISYIECSNTVRKFLPKIIFNFLRKLESKKLPKSMFFRGIMTYQKKDKAVEN